MRRRARGGRLRWGAAIALVVACLFVVVAIIGPYVAPDNPDAGIAAALAAPSAHHLFGTDSTGRDLLSRLLVGTRVSAIVGLGSVLVGGIVGTALGMLAGLRSGRVADVLVMRTMDAILAFPVIVLAAVISGVTVAHGNLSIGPVSLGAPEIVALVIALILTPVFARIARASMLSEIQKEYVLAARICGVRDRVLVWRFILPNIASPLLVQASVSVALAIVAEAGISFLGLGVQPPQPSWGNIISDGQSNLVLGDWWLVVFPAAAIAVVTVAFTVLGEWCRVALDPERSVGSHLAAEEGGALAAGVAPALVGGTEEMIR